jgi:RHS repeat-associated protein
MLAPVLAAVFAMVFVVAPGAQAQVQCRPVGGLPGLQGQAGPGSPLGQLGSRPRLDGLLADIAMGAGGSAAARCEARAEASATSEPASRPQAQPSLAAGNPVDVLTGAKHERVVDLAMPAADSLTVVDGSGRPDPVAVTTAVHLEDSLSLVFARHYSSGQSHALSLGAGWSHSFETRLARQVLRPATTASAAALPPVRLQLLQGDGRRVFFAPVAILEGPVRGLRLASTDLHDGLIEERHGPTGRSWLWRWPSGRVIEFDHQGRMIGIESPDRDRLSLQRAADGTLESIVDRHGRALRFEYQAGRLAALVLPDGGRIVYLYDEARRLVAVRQPDGRLTRYHYEDRRGAHWLTGITGPDGLRSIYRYDAEGRVLETLAAGASEHERLRFSYHGSADRGYTEVQWQGLRSSYHRALHAGLPMLGRSEGPGCPVCPPTGLIYRRDAAGRLLEQGDWRFSYDRHGRLAGLSDTRHHEAPAWTLHYGSDDPLAPPALIEARSVVPGRVRRLEFTHNERGQLLRMREQGFTPGPEGPRAIERETRFSYQADGPAAGKRVAIERRGDPADGLVAVTRLVWSAERTLMALIHPEGIEHRIERDRLARPVREQLPDGSAVERAFDVGWRVVRLRSAEHDLRWSWHADGRLAEVAFADGERWSLAVESEERVLVTASGRRYHFSREATTRLSRQSGASPLPGLPDRAVEGLTRALPQALTIEGRSTRVIDVDGRLTEFVRDDLGRTVLERASGLGERWFDYDALGRLALIRDGAARELHLRHDAAGRLIEREERQAGESTITRLEWAGTRLVAIGHPAERLRLLHDTAARLRRIERTDSAGRSRVFEFRRDALGRLIERELGDGLALRTDYDRHGRASGLALAAPGLGAAYPIVERRWRADGSLDVDVIGRGLLERTDLQDSDGRPAGVRWSRARDQRLVAHWRLRHDAQARVLAIAHRAGEDRFGYDPFGRLIIRERADGRHEYFLHSAGGDLLARRDAAGVGSTLADGPHDDRGRPLALEGWQLHYGASGRIERAHRLAEWPQPGGTVQQPIREVRHVYNAFGERVGKAVVDAAGRRFTTGFLYHGQRLSAELDDQGRIVRHYLYWQGRPLAFVEVDPARPGRIQRLVHLVTDHLGTPQIALDGAGRLLWEGHYDSLGALRDARGSLRQPLRLPGQYHDEETGLHDNYLRTYDPRQGRYLEPDPLGLAGGLNRHAYVNGNPHLASDPLGLILFAFDGTGNGLPARAPDTLSNVARLFSLYEGDDGRYMTGVGLDDPATGIRATLLDRYDAGTARARVDAMLAALDARLRMPQRAAEPVQVDVIGFSRGAAMARDFANTVAARIRSGHYASLQRCVNLNFVGLWDTVAQFGLNGIANERWNLSVPAEAKVVVHAVAANEHRRLFPLESILPDPPASRTGGSTAGLRLERAFIGDHADIGGSHGEGDLADVTLAWMYRHARAAGVDLAELDPAWQIVSEPLVHDSRSITQPGPDREVRHGDGRTGRRGTVAQRAMTGAGLSWQQTQDLIRRYRSPRAGESSMIVGEVDIAAYADWLDEHYDLRIGF